MCCGTTIRQLDFNLSNPIPPLEFTSGGMGYGTQKRGTTVNSREQLSQNLPWTSDIADTDKCEIVNGLKMLGLSLRKPHKH